MRRHLCAEPAFTLAASVMQPRALLFPELQITWTMALEAMLKMRCCQNGRSLASCRQFALQEGCSPGGCTIRCRMQVASSSSASDLSLLLLAPAAKFNAALSMSCQAQQRIN